MKRLFTYLIITFGTLFLLSNSAQPGIWNAGGSGSFQLLFPEDSIAYKKIQMQSEQVYMQWYKGFAVIKGVYHFNNTTNDTLRIKVGYPINYVFKNIGYKGFKNQVAVDDLYKIKGQVNNQELQLINEKKDTYINWYVWEVTYPPKKMTTFTVHFLVKTNDATLTRGYNHEDKNAFIYLIETGSLWKSPIEHGEFYMQLKNEYDIEKLKGASPSKLFYNKNDRIIKFSMENYGRFPDDNFVLTYPETLENFNFEKIAQKSDAYFKAIDAFSQQNLEERAYEKLQLLTPYEIEDGDSWGDFFSILFVFTLVWLPIILVGLVAFMTVFMIYKYFKKKKKGIS